MTDTRSGCTWYINPFAMEEDDGDGLCGAEPAEETQFRRKTDGVIHVTRRCSEHRIACNDAWEPVEP